MDDLNIALLVYLENEKSSEEDEKNRLEEREEGLKIVLLSAHFEF